MASRQDSRPTPSAAMRPEPILLSWSGGKDSALALAALAADPAFEVVGLLTSVTRDYDRVSIHGVRRALLARQAASLGITLHEIVLPAPCTNAMYESAFLSALASACAEHDGVQRIAFGDLFLIDVRAYRERLLAGSGVEPLFPLWGIPTNELARQCIDAGFRARLVCVDTTQLDARFVGRAFDHELLAELPPTVDPCGERGEFHTFVADGPGFAEPIAYEVGEIVIREERFAYCDLLPAVAATVADGR
jgi:uncharacterized protein (TIGR00290 family)